MPFLAMIPISVVIDCIACYAFAQLAVMPLMNTGLAGNLVLLLGFVVLIAVMVAIDVFFICLADAIEERIRYRRLKKYDYK